MIEHIAEAVKWFKGFFPALCIIMPNEQGVKVVRGDYRGILDVGWYIYWPLMTEIKVLDVTRQFLTTPCQSIMTQSGMSVAISLAVEYTIEDPFKAYFLVQDYDTSLRDLTMGVVAARVAVSQDLPDMDELRADVATELEVAQVEWGLDIMNVYLHDYCKHKVIRIMNPEAATDVLGE